MNLTVQRIGGTMLIGPMIIDSLQFQRMKRKYTYQMAVTYCKILIIIKLLVTNKIQSDRYGMSHKHYSHSSIPVQFSSIISERSTNCARKSKLYLPTL